MNPYLYKTFINNYENILQDIDLNFLRVLENIKYNPATENITSYKKNILELFANEGFVMKYPINSTLLTISGVKSDIGLQVQLGNAARFYADMIKLQWFFDNNVIKYAVYVCFTKSAAKDSYADNLVNMDRCIRELKLFKEIISIPTVVVGLDYVDQ
ncbi:hypothetical protein N9C43_04910 [Gammaproteobacteria bacterium]|nr:hypothetical protein [Gammaproteobacteria bacterium]